MECIKQNFEKRIGTATMGIAFMVSSLFMAIPNRTLMYQAMHQGGVVEVMGFGLFIAGACTFWGSMFPRRKLRHIGQFLSFILGWWSTINATAFNIIPATPVLLAVLGTGLLVIWVRDVFAGVHHRNALRTGHYGLQQ